MNWYYLSGGEKKGPFDAVAFRDLYKNGTIGLKQMVMTDGMNVPIQLDQAIRSGKADELNLQDAVECPTCGSSVTMDELIPMDNIKVCPNCRDEYIQRSKEGVSLENTSLDLASLWARVGGAIIDGILLQVVQYGTAFILAAAGNDSVILGGTILTAWILPALYAILLMAGKTQGTLGMMAVGIKIVRPDGSKISHKQALGRYLAAIVSSLILMIGYLMAIWDDEKRTLHDRWADTRVVKR